MTTSHSHAHDGGLAADLPRLVSRRRMLGFGGAGLAAALLAGCGDDDNTTSTPTTDTTSAPATSRASVETGAGEIPAETAGPLPGDGSNGPDALTASGVVRKDIRSSFGSGSATAEGVPLRIKLTILDLEDGTSTPLAGAVVYLWHCDREGRYSMYSEGVTGENYLRGVQVADARGELEFLSIFPACYTGRWPHIHFEIYRDAQTATSAGAKLRTTQLALPADVCETVYASPGYESSVRNVSTLSLETDNIFSDGYRLQLAKVTGTVRDGYTATLAVLV